MLASFTDFADQLRPHLPGAFEPALKSAFSSAARTFYRRSRAWRETITLTPNVDGGLSLAPYSDYADLAYLEAVFRATTGAPIPRHVSPGPAQMLTWRTSGGIGRVSMISPTRLQADYNPEAVEPLFLEFSIQPKQNSDTVPYFATTHHYDGLEAGTLAKMMLQPHKSYSNGEAAGFYSRKFETEIARAREMQRSGFGGGTNPANIPVVRIK